MLNMTRKKNVIAWGCVTAGNKKKAKILAVFSRCLLSRASMLFRSFHVMFNITSIQNNKPRFFVAKKRLSEFSGRAPAHLRFLTSESLLITTLRNTLVVQKSLYSEEEDTSKSFLVRYIISKCFKFCFRKVYFLDWLGKERSCFSWWHGHRSSLRHA